ncbi:MAG: MATE family efflux transporter [Nevskiales bacterium]
MTPERRRTILALSLPIIGGMTSQNLLNLVDTAMVGVLGAPALAAVGIVSFVTFVATALITGLSAAVQATAARRFGEGKLDETAVPLNGGLLIAVVVGLPMSFGLILATPWILPLLISDPAVIEQGQPYMVARLAGVVAVGMNFSFRGYWNGVNQSRVYLYTLLVMHAVNVLLNYCLIFGKFGFPELGTLGAGIGTTASVFFGSLIYFVMARRRADSAGFLHRRPSAEQLRALIRLGLPNSIQQFFFAAGFTVLYWIIGQVGTNELAVANVLINITLVAVLPGIGMGLAAASLVGQSLGRQDPADAHRWAWDVCKVGAVIFIGLGLPMVLIPDLLLGLFLHEPHLLELGELPLRLVGAGIVLDGIGLIMLNALLGAGASGTVMRVAISLQWFIFLPMAWVLGPLMGFGLLVIWIAFLSYRLAQALIFIGLWEKKLWVDIKV